jgi:hypothetical protein
MIDDLDRTLEVLLKRELPANIVQQATISFAAPDEQFPPEKVTLPAIDLFLYDLRENEDLRSNEWVVPTKEEREALAKKQPPRVRLHRPSVRLDCSYLITAWTSSSAPESPYDEHKILSEVARVLLRHPTIPKDLLQGALAGQQPALPTSSLQGGRLQNVSDFWQVLGKPKAALHYVVTISVDPFAPLESGLVTEGEMRFALGVGEDASATNEVGVVIKDADRIVEQPFTLADVRESMHPSKE